MSHGPGVRRPPTAEQHQNAQRRPGRDSSLTNGERHTGYASERQRTCRLVPASSTPTRSGTHLNATGGEPAHRLQQERVQQRLLNVTGENTRQRDPHFEHREYMICRLQPKSAKPAPIRRWRTRGHALRPARGAGGTSPDVSTVAPRPARAATNAAASRTPAPGEPAGIEMKQPHRRRSSQHEKHDERPPRREGPDPRDDAGPRDLRPGRRRRCVREDMRVCVVCRELADGARTTVKGSAGS